MECGDPSVGPHISHSLCAVVGLDDMEIGDQLCVMAEKRGLYSKTDRRVQSVLRGTSE